MLKDSADKIPDEVKTEIEGNISAVRTALQGEDVAQINSAMQELQASLQKVGEAVYGQPEEQGAGPAPEEGSEEGSEDKPPDETVEGEFREV
jgi:molecular chaperone DnaK